MTTKTPEQQADEIVEMFAEEIRPVIYGQLLERDWEYAKKVSVLHVTGIIEVLKRDNNIIVDGEYPYMVSVNQDAIDHHQQILTILKEKL